jgi:putative ABC transport system ATP-binding protein
MHSNPLIALKNIQFSYPKAAQSTLNINEFIVNVGERIFLFGPSGCGKTTLLEILAGVLIPQIGEVNICSTDLCKISAHERDVFRAANIGYIFQSFNLIPYLTVEENITLPLYLSPARRERTSQTEQQQQLEMICNSLGISNILHSPVTELSVGQQQRVAAARSLMGKPQLILADEPTSALDFDHREKFIKLLFELCERINTTIVFVSHDRTLMNLFDRSVSIMDISSPRSSNNNNSNNKNNFSSSTNPQ